MITVAGTSHEGADRANLTLAGYDLLDAVVPSCKKTIVVVITPGAFLAPWADEVDAILCMYLPGQEEGSAVADVIFGKVEPGGRLPHTIPNRENEVELTEKQ